ncbi:hypothetical protein [Mucilaginibacter sp.]
MRTSLNKIRAIDDYLLGSMHPGDKLLFEANVILSEDLENDVKYQKSTYTIMGQYGRKRIKDEIIAVQNILTTNPQHRGFVQRIANLFKKH